MSEKFRSLEEEILSGKDIVIPEFLGVWLSKKKSNYIGGKWIDSESVFETFNPATGEKLATVSEAGKEETLRAVASAREAFAKGEWANATLSERAAKLKQLASLIFEHRAPLAILETLDTGKPIRESFEGDVLRAAKNFEFFADYALSDEGTAYPKEKEFHFSFREPLGVVALITPWNLPLYLETWKIAPCLMMGNSCVLKPSEVTPLTAAYLAELVAEVGFPDGVFNLIHGLGENSAGAFLTSHPDIDAISFTGETVTGKAIMKAASDHLTKVSFELGGKGASIVFDDANLEKAVEASLRAAFRNQGEICLACPRIFVHSKIRDAFLSSFVERAKSIRVGNPLNIKTEMGALVGKEHFEKVRGFIERIESPIQTLCGGKAPTDSEKGYFLEPTVLAGVPLSHEINQKEIFGPVVAVNSFEDEAEVLKAVNGVSYGLSASVWTQNLDRAYRFSRKVTSGLVWVNCWFVRDLRVPFGGQKSSGLGREGGKHSLDFFSEWKSVCIQMES